MTFPAALLCIFDSSVREAIIHVDCNPGPGHIIYVVRILGNDYTHYERKYPQHDFELLKGYMEIFLKQIEVRYMVNHPPVSRTP